MSAVTTVLHVTDPADPIRTRMTTGIPVLSLGGDEFTPAVEITTSVSLLAPDEQAAWWRELQTQAGLLAAQVETRHGLGVAS